MSSNDGQLAVEGSTLKGMVAVGGGQVVGKVGGAMVGGFIEGYTGAGATANAAVQDAEAVAQVNKGAGSTAPTPAAVTAPAAEPTPAATSMANNDPIFGNKGGAVVAEPKGGTYLLRDAETGEVMRTGRTNDFVRRQGEHALDPALEKFKFEIVDKTDDYSEQRGLEQMLHDVYQPPLNKIRPISPTNPNRQSYLDAAQSYTQGGGG
jgi:hypothetical protein